MKRGVELKWFGDKTPIGYTSRYDSWKYFKDIKKLPQTIEILKTMREDEDLHAGQANESGAEELKSPTKKIMETTAKIMTSSSAYI